MRFGPARTTRHSAAGIGGRVAATRDAFVTGRFLAVCWLAFGCLSWAIRPSACCGGQGAPRLPWSGGEPRFGLSYAGRGAMHAQRQPQAAQPTVRLSGCDPIAGDASRVHENLDQRGARSIMSSARQQAAACACIAAASKQPTRGRYGRRTGGVLPGRPSRRMPPLLERRGVARLRCAQILTSHRPQRRRCLCLHGRNGCGVARLRCAQVLTSHRPRRRRCLCLHGRAGGCRHCWNGYRFARG